MSSLALTDGKLTVTGTPDFNQDNVNLILKYVQQQNPFAVESITSDLGFASYKYRDKQLAAAIDKPGDYIKARLVELEKAEKAVKEEYAKVFFDLTETGVPHSQAQDIALKAATAKAGYRKALINRQFPDSIFDSTARELFGGDDGIRSTKVIKGSSKP
jgi:hypothetical protein